MDNKKTQQSVFLVVFGALAALSVLVGILWVKVTDLSYQSNKMSHEIQELRDDAARQAAQ